MGHPTSNRALFSFHISVFLRILLVSRVQTSIEKAAKKTLKSEFPAKLHPPKAARLPLDMSLLQACNLARFE